MTSPLLVWSSIAFDTAFLIFHVLFWRIFNWPAKLAPIGPLNSAITQTLNLMLIYVFGAFVTGLALIPTDSGRRWVLYAGVGFWLLRAAVQPLLFGARSAATLLMSSLFAGGALTHAAAALV